MSKTLFHKAPPSLTPDLHVAPFLVSGPSILPPPIPSPLARLCKNVNATILGPALKIKAQTPHPGLGSPSCTTSLFPLSLQSSSSQTFSADLSAHSPVLVTSLTTPLLTLPRHSLCFSCLALHHICPLISY